MNEGSPCCGQCAWCEAGFNISEDKALAEVIEVISGQDAPDFDLSVTMADGWCTVSTTALDTGTRAIGEGPDFGAAWFDQKPTWAQENRP
ncbi:hypothetical protein [Lichenicoccus sp.]|uniref:hypothetical protein n=1 Tax=Lichenicoccus sp. TaxID=2781899 RepID=UPI003D0AF6AD